MFICRSVFIASISGVRNDKKTYRLYSQGVIGRLPAASDACR